MFGLVLTQSLQALAQPTIPPLLHLVQSLLSEQARLPLDQVFSEAILRQQAPQDLEGLAQTTRTTPTRIRAVLVLVHQAPVYSAPPKTNRLSERAPVQAIIFLAVDLHRQLSGAAILVVLVPRQGSVNNNRRRIKGLPSHPSVPMSRKRREPVILVTTRASISSNHIRISHSRN